MGKRLAHSFISNNILEYLELSNEHSIVEVIAGKKMIGKNLITLDVRAKFGCNIVAIKRGSEIDVSPEADQPLHEGDILIVIGADQDINRFEKAFIFD